MIRTIKKKTTKILSQRFCFKDNVTIKIKTIKFLFYKYPMLVCNYTSNIKILKFLLVTKLDL